MTQAKKSLYPTKKEKLSKMQIKAQQLSQDYLALSQEQRNLITDFFNLHNAAVNLYNLMTDETKQVCDAYITASQKASKIE